MTKILFSAVLLAAAALSAAPSDFDVIIDRIASEGRRGGVGARVADTLTAAETVRTQRADGTWADIDYANKGRSYWPTTRHLSRATALADAFRAGKDPACRDAARRALAWWLKTKPRNPNWWFNVIGTPRQLADFAVRFDAELTDRERARIAETLAAAEPKKRMTGQNAAWIDEVRFLRGVLTRDAETVRAALADMLAEVRVSDDEGITRDWCYHQHGRQPQFGNYGLSFLAAQARLAKLLEGTAFAYPEEKRAIVRALASEGYAWIVWKGMMDVSAMGRQLFRNAQRDKARAVRRAFDDLAATGWTEPAAPTGFRFFDRSAYAVHRTEKWMASVRASTSSIIGVETWINEDNVKGMCMADGALLTYVTGREYDNVFPLWDDWRMIPGVTGYAGKPVDRKRRMNGADDVRGARTADGGTFAFTFRREGLVARKKWTFSDDGILCEGAGITASDGRWEVMTSVEEALAAPDAGIVYEKPDEFCARNGDIVYVVRAPRASVRFEIADRTGDFRDFMQAMPSAKVSGKVFSLRISHGFAPTNAVYSYRIVPCAAPSVSKRDYLDLTEAAVAAYDDVRLRRYIDETDRDGVHEHGFPRLTSNLGALLADGRLRERRDLFKRMMDICCRDAKKGMMEKEGNEFSVKELVAAIVDVERAKLFPKAVTDGWRRDIAAVDPWRCYGSRPTPGDPERSYNWCVFGCASEQMRLSAGMGGCRKFVDRYVPDQMRWFDVSGMWLEPHQPIVYDMVTRLQFALILSAGYDGPGRAKLGDWLDRGVGPTLAMQSAVGEIPYGGRSNQFLHNDTLYAALCEWYAARLIKRGDRRTAARFKAAARRTVDGLRRWLAERPVRHVKNLYPRGEGTRGSGIGCEAYAYFDKYMVTMGSWSTLAARFADETPLPAVEEADTAAFASTPPFHIVCLRSGDYSAQFDYNADTHYDCDGLGRLHRRGAPPQICLSTPCTEKPSYLTEKPNAGPLAFIPVADAPLVFAGSGNDAGSAWANWTLGGLDWRCRLTAAGLVSVLTGAGSVAMRLPAFAFDGACETTVTSAGKRLAVRYRGWTATYETDGAIVDTGATCWNRNGRYRVFEARGENAVTVSITIERE